MSSPDPKVELNDFLNERIIKLENQMKAILEIMMPSKIILSPKKKNNLSFGEAMQAMEEGEKVKRSCWHESQYICILFNNFINEKSNLENISYRQITANDWEILN